MTRIRLATLLCLAGISGFAVRGATAQCPEQPTPTSGPLRATLDCVPESGGGSSFTTTCTISGDLSWLYQNSNGLIPYGACGAQLQFSTNDWQACRAYLPLADGYIASYEFSVEPTVTAYTYCNVPATGSRGATILIVLVAALGVFILWPRRG